MNQVFPNETNWSEISNFSQFEFVLLTLLLLTLLASPGTNVNAVAQLANKYDMRNVVDMCEQFMLEDDTEYTYQTLLTAQQCHMTTLLQHSAYNLSRYLTLKQLKTCKEFTSFKADTVLILLMKMLKRFEDLFEQGTFHVNGREYNMENWHTCPHL